MRRKRTAVVWCSSAKARVLADVRARPALCRAMSTDFGKRHEGRQRAARDEDPIIARAGLRSSFQIAVDHLAMRCFNIVSMRLNTIAISRQSELSNTRRSHPEPCAERH